MEERGMRTLPILATIVGLLLAGCEKARLDDEVRRLCAKDGGIKVYEVVVLPLSRFDQYGAIRIPSKEDAKSTDEFYYVSETTYLRSGDPEMWRTRHQIVRAKNGKLLGERISYSRRGGDIPGSWHESSFGCPASDVRPSLEETIFMKDYTK
jgi:hypothetical protein